MKLIVALLLVCFSFALGRTRWFELDGYSFEKYVKEYNKHYTGAEYEVRKQNFDAKLQKVTAHNRDSQRTWKEGINHMSDWSQDEYKQMLGYKKSYAFASKAASPVIQDNSHLSLRALPKTVDWRGKGVVSAVKDQGMCVSCWTFATAETIESHWAMAKGDLTDLSEQQILDCTPNPQQCGGTGGCNGGTTELAYAQIMQNGGLSSEWTYPYLSYFTDSFQCHFNASNTKPMVQLSSFKVLPSNEYLPLLDAVASHGPIAITVDASAWSDYEQGVFDGCNQTNPDLDHAVVLVGYGTDEDFGDYWLVRNSWSPLWGEKGYVRLARPEKVSCGTDLNPSDGTGCKGGPPQVTVCGTCGILYDSTYPIIQK
jgi:cathepsin L